MHFSTLFHKDKSLPYLLLFMGAVLFFSCSSLPIDSPRIVKKYAVGQGGGFTGDYIEFSFTENGDVFKRDFNNQRDVFYKRIGEGEVKYFIDKITELGIPTLDINYPGNVSRYFEIREGETTLNKIVWGANNYKPNQNIVDLHREIYKKLAEFE